MAQKKRIGVLLCGCGHRDGSEIHEATLTLLALDMAGAEAVCAAPAGNTLVVRNHLTGAEVHEQRDMLIESARIARGEIRNITQLTADGLDALIIPGGQGAALNLSNYLIEGRDCTVLPEVERLISEMAKAQKPIGAICIAPATLARALQTVGIFAKITCGDDNGCTAAIEAMGHSYVVCPPTDCIVDRENKIVTTPAYMNANSISEVWQGIKKLVDAVLELA